MAQTKASFLNEVRNSDTDMLRLNVHSLVQHLMGVGNDVLGYRVEPEIAGFTPSERLKLYCAELERRGL